jgi:uncharacterized membrane protein YsdA (DUF1294 family)
MPRRSRENARLLHLPFALLMLMLAGALWLASPWRGLAAWWLALGVPTLCTYAFDKWMSRAGAWRVPELVLHTLAMAGGFAGAAIGMLLLRHKTRHLQFVFVIGLAALLHAVLWFAAPV